MYGDHLHVFLSFLHREISFVTSCCFPGKNLLLEEQILSFKSKSPFGRTTKMKMAELLSLNVLPIHLSAIDFYF